MKRFISLAVIAIVAVSAVGLNFSGKAYGATYTAQDVALHNTQSNCWMIIDNKVYNMTSYIPNHPGGPSAIVGRCGADGTALFNSGPHPASQNSSVLASYYLGDLVAAQPVPNPLVFSSGVTATPSQSSVVLRWNSATGGVAPLTYTVIRNGSSVATVSATTFTDINLTPGTVYAYSIRTTDSASPVQNIVNSSNFNVQTLPSSTPAPSPLPEPVPTPEPAPLPSDWHDDDEGLEIEDDDENEDEDSEIKSDRQERRDREIRIRERNNSHWRQETRSRVSNSFSRFSRFSHDD